MKRITHWIDGKPFVGDAERHGKVFNPATGEQTGEVGLATGDEVDAAVAAATRRVRRGGRLTGEECGDVFAFATCRRHRAELADLTAEHGKVNSDALAKWRGAWNRGVRLGVPNIMKGGFSEHVSTGVDVYSLRQPLGVVAGITPSTSRRWCPCGCFPGDRAGNAFVLKPS